MRLKPLDFPDLEPGLANAVRPRSEASFRSITADELAEILGAGARTSSGAVVNVDSAMRVAVAYRCTHILAGACGNLPIDLYRRTSEQSREVAVGHPLREILQRPNAWQTSSEFRKMLTAHAVLKGNGYAIKVTSRGRLLALWPLKNPDRMRPRQDPATMRIKYDWTRDDGSKLELDQADVLHLRGLTLDGITGVGIVAHARQALGLSLQAEEAAARTFKQGVIAGLVFTKAGRLSDEAFDRLKQQIEHNNAGAENARKALILEEDLKVDGSLMSAEDLQFLETRAFTRSDVGIFFGVPPHLYGDTEKTAAPTTGVEAIGSGFVTFTANDWFVMWEQALERDCLTAAELAAGMFVRLQRQALLRTDFKSRQEALEIQARNGVINPDEWRGIEDMNPRADGEGGKYYDPAAAHVAGKPTEAPPK